MSIQRIPVPISFNQGLNQKIDSKQLQIGKFQSLNNAQFNKIGLLAKRNGFGLFTQLTAPDLSSLTTYSESLVALGNTLNIFSEEQGLWLNKGPVNQLSLSTLSLVRSSTGQTSVDAVLAYNGLSCEVWVDSDGTSKYQVNDSSNGQVLLSATDLPTGAMSPRVFALPRYFLITFLIDISATPHLQYIAVPFTNLNNPSTATDISSQVKSNAAGYDGAVNNGILYIAWNASDIGGAIREVSIGASLVQSANHVIPGHTADLMSIQVNPVNVNVWITYWNNTNNDGYTSILDMNGNQVLAPTLVINTVVITALTSALQNGVLNIFYEVLNTYPSGVRSDYTRTEMVTSTGVVSAPVTLLRSVGIASKAFLYNNLIYILLAYNGAFQPTYFLSDISGNIQVKLAYSNGGGYVTGQVLPSVSYTSSGDIYIGYLYKDLLLSVSKINGSANNSGIYTQTGVNSVTLDFSTPAYSVEIGSNLNLSGGIVTSYDGVKPVEQEFHLWPEDITISGSATGGAMLAQQYFYQVCYEWTDGQGNLFRSAPSVPLSVTLSTTTSTAFTSVFSAGDTSLDVSSTAGLVVGQTLIDQTNPTSLTSGTYITSIVGSVIGLSQPAAGNSDDTPGDTIGIATSVVFTGTFAANSTTMTVSTTAGLIVGQTIMDSTNIGAIQPGTYIVSISGSTLVISLPTIFSGSGDSIITSDFASATLVIPTLRLTAKPNARIVVYRWSVANQIYYMVSSITNPTLNNTGVDTVTYVDTQNDNQIVGNVIIYTTGGVVENIAPPSTQIMTLFGSRLFLLDAEDTNLLWYSKQVIEATPVEMSDLFTIYVAPTIGSAKSTGPITSLGNMDDKLIIFKRDAAYYLQGVGPDNTGANDDFITPTFIAGTVGCSNQQSIVLIPTGLMFQSDKGIWLMDRNLGTSYIGANVEDFTSSATVLSAITIPGTNQVRFTLDSGVTLMYDYYVQEWSTFVNIPGISSCIYNNLHTYLRSDGEIFQETDGVYLDGSSPTLMSFTTSWFNVAGLQGYQRAFQYYLLGQYLTPHFLQVQTAYDYQSNPSQSNTIMPDNFSPVWGSDLTWGASTPWGGPSPSEQWRVDLTQQKCQAVQISVQEIYDPSFGVPAGAGFTMSGLNLIMGAKSGYPRLAPTRIVGGS
jgi:hypothetical protein